MIDKEVGELWHIHAGDGCNIEKLIRKLVEEVERDLYYEGGHGPRNRCRWLALQRFGIDPATWLKE